MIDPVKGSRETAVRSFSPDLGAATSIRRTTAEVGPHLLLATDPIVAGGAIDRIAADLVAQ
jgi:hypothetical protein